MVLLYTCVGWLRPIDWESGCMEKVKAGSLVNMAGPKMERMGSKVTTVAMYSAWCAGAMLFQNPSQALGNTCATVQKNGVAETVCADSAINVDSNGKKPLGDFNGNKPLGCEKPRFKERCSCSDSAKGQINLTKESMTRTQDMARSLQATKTGLNTIYDKIKQHKNIRILRVESEKPTPSGYAEYRPERIILQGNKMVCHDRIARCETGKSYNLATTQLLKEWHLTRAMPIFDNSMTHKMTIKINVKGESTADGIVIFGLLDNLSLWSQAAEKRQLGTREILTLIEKTSKMTDTIISKSSQSLDNHQKDIGLMTEAASTCKID
jgi:hypothetical protein